MAETETGLRELVVLACCVYDLRLGGHLVCFLRFRQLDRALGLMLGGFLRL